MRLLLDMNLSPSWVRFLEENGFVAIHWVAIGPVTATDAAIMAWARENGHVVITHDLDFSALLASTEATGPSVILLRGQDILPSAMGPVVVRSIREHVEALDQGAVLSVDASAARLRILPIRRD
jgi:predicted nuclease of predicted toxin-antitoxin system